MPTINKHPENGRWRSSAILLSAAASLVSCIGGGSDSQVDEVCLPASSGTFRVPAQPKEQLLARAAEFALNAELEQPAEVPGDQGVFDLVYGPADSASPATTFRPEQAGADADWPDADWPDADWPDADWVVELWLLGGSEPGSRADAIGAAFIDVFEAVQLEPDDSDDSCAPSSGALLTEADSNKPPRLGAKSAISQGAPQARLRARSTSAGTTDAPPRLRRVPQEPASAEPHERDVEQPRSHLVSTLPPLKPVLHALALQTDEKTAPTLELSGLRIRYQGQVGEPTAGGKGNSSNGPALFVLFYDLLPDVARGNETVLEVLFNNVVIGSCPISIPSTDDGNGPKMNALFKLPDCRGAKGYAAPAVGISLHSQ